MSQDAATAHARHEAPHTAISSSFALLTSSRILGAGARKAELERSIQGHTLAQAEVIEKSQR
jgi:hypothetical protein